MRFRATLLLAILCCLGSSLQAALPRGLSECERVYYPGEPVLKSSSISIKAKSDNQISTQAEARVALPNLSRLAFKANECWGLTLLPSKGVPITVTLRFGNSLLGELSRTGVTRLEVKLGNKTLFDKEVAGFNARAKAYNTLSIRCEGSRLAIGGGADAISPLADVEIPSAFTVNSVKLQSVGEAHVSLFTVEQCATPRHAQPTAWTGARLKEYLSRSRDPYEGVWRYFDRQNDPDYALPGGTYTIATVRANPHSDSQYHIIYLSGADVNANHWRPYMLKGTLTRTIFSEQCDLKWFDSDFVEITDDISAEIKDGAILTVAFPLYRTLMRFAKVPFAEVLRLPE